MAHSLGSAAARLLTVAHTLNNPADREIATKFVEDMRALAACEVAPPALPPSFKQEQVDAATLGTALHRAFPLNYDATFAGLIRAL